MALLMIRPLLNRLELRRGEWDISPCPMTGAPVSDEEDDEEDCANEKGDAFPREEHTRLFVWITSERKRLRSL